jgi:hypothetical protein
MTFHTSGHIRSTNETNFQGRIRALVFGEDNRVINPGDMILEMEHSDPGDRLGNNTKRFEIYIAGREMAGLLGQITRAADLFKLNAEWLLSPSSRTLTPQEIEDRKPITHEPIKRGVFDHSKEAEIRERDRDLPTPKLS